MDCSVRIIAGLYRGKKITFPALPDLRPTADRIKETLFNWLMHEIQGANCLDAFAGSGSLGFEAFSRGADSVTLLESSAIACNALQRTAKAFNNPKLSIIQTNALSYLKTCQTPFNIIFLDPPFKSNFLELSIDLLRQGSCLASGGLVYLESTTPLVLDSTCWSLRKSKKAGQVYYSLVEKR